MDDTLLNQYIESGPYPNMHKTAVVDERTSKLNQGPVILEVNTGPGRIVLSVVIFAQRAALFERILIILIGLPKQRNKCSTRNGCPSLWAIQVGHIRLCSIASDPHA
jgi:hypothetical protein